MVPGEVYNVYVARMRFYSDDALEISAELKDIFQYTDTQGEFEVVASVSFSENEQRKELI